METDPLLTRTQHQQHSLIKMPRILNAAQRKFLVGVSLLLLVVILWTWSSFITSDLLGGGYDKPFLITYLNTASFTFYLLPFLFKRWKNDRNTPSSSIDKNDYSALSQIEEQPIHSRPPVVRTLRRSNSLIRSLSPSPALTIASHPHLQSNPLSPISHTISLSQGDGNPQTGTGMPGAGQSGIVGTVVSIPEEPLQVSIPIPVSITDIQGDEVNGEGSSTMEKLTPRETAKLAALFCLAWMAANWSLNASLGLTSVGSSTVLAGMSGFFTLGLGRLVGVEKFTRPKILAVVASFIGLILVTHSDSLISTSSSAPTTINSLLTSNFTTISTTNPLLPISSHPKSPLTGDLLALLSAFCYALYVILLKVKIGDEDRIDMQLFFGFVGLFNTILLAPLIPILDWTGGEKFELPTKREEWAVCGVNMLITLSSDYLYVLAMLKTTPVVVTVGLSLTIPFAMLGDLLRGSTAGLTVQALGGAGLVVAGFGLMGIEGWGEGMSGGSGGSGSGEIVVAEVHQQQQQQQRVGGTGTGAEVEEDSRRRLLSQEGGARRSFAEDGVRGRSTASKGKGKGRAMDSSRSVSEDSLA